MMMVMMSGAAFVNNNANRDVQRSPRAHYHPSPSPPLKRHATDSAINYPDLKQWFASLEENSTRNKHGEKFTQYTNALVTTHKLFTIEDIIPLTASELATVGEMEFGTASRIIRFAKEDAAALEKNKRPHLGITNFT
jgi:hypothetical protein